MIRIDKYLCDMNLGTRSELKKLLKSGLVTINGEVIKDPNSKIDETKDIVTFKGKRVNYQKYGYYLLHKPAGCVTAKKDNLYKTVMEYMPKHLLKDYSPVGRLDLDTEGLLIITNDGELNHHLISPNHNVPKTYLAYLDKKVPEEAIELFKNGIDIGDDKLTLPADLVIHSIEKDINGNNIYSAELIIQEGRFHQVKRMFHSVGCEVIYLKRLSEGNLSLGDLAPGEYRELTLEEVESLKHM